MTRDLLSAFQRIINLSERIDFCQVNVPVGVVIYAGGTMAIRNSLSDIDDIVTVETAAKKLHAILYEVESEMELAIKENPSAKWIKGP